MSCEYYCKKCGQLRLSFRKIVERCANCNSTKIIIGDVLELDKEVLRKKYPLRERRNRCLTFS